MPKCYKFRNATTILIFSYNDDEKILENLELSNSRIRLTIFFKNKRLAIVVKIL